MSPSTTKPSSTSRAAISTPTARPSKPFLLLNDFEANGLQNWNTFQSSNSYAVIRLVSPGQAGANALKVDYQIAEHGWAGVGRDFPTRQNWGAYRGIQFKFNGTNSGSTIRFEILDNSAAGRSGDTAERFEYKFVDNFNGWRTFILPWNVFARRSDWQPQGAPNDGFNLTAIPGFNVSPVNGQGSFQVDDMELIN